MAAKKVLKLLVKAKSGGKRVKYFKTKKSYNRWLKEGKGKKVLGEGETFFGKDKVIKVPTKQWAFGDPTKQTKKAGKKLSPQVKKDNEIISNHLGLVNKANDAKRRVEYFESRGLKGFNMTAKQYKAELREARKLEKDLRKKADATEKAYRKVMEKYQK